MKKKDLGLKFVIPDRNGADVVLWKSRADEGYQWVKRVPKFSSSYNSGWEASCLIGPPRVYPSYGDIRGAYASSASTGTHEWLELDYETPVFVTGIDIFETYNPGHVTNILIKVGDYWIPLWSGVVLPVGHGRPGPQSRIFSPPLKPTVFRSDQVRIEMDCTTARSWAEIDCVLLKGVERVSWSPSLHHLYPPSFRAAVKVFSLVCQRYNLHDDVRFRVINFLAEGWVLQETDVAAYGGKKMF